MASFEQQDTYNKVSAIIADTLHIDKNAVTPQATFDGLGADSLDKLEMIMKFEETFGIEINDEEAMAISTVAQAVEKVHTLRTK